MTCGTMLNFQVNVCMFSSSVTTPSISAKTQQFVQKKNLVMILARGSTRTVAALIRSIEPKARPKNLCVYVNKEEEGVGLVRWGIGINLEEAMLVCDRNVYMCARAHRQAGAH